jgi:hypothetical protein
MLYAFGFDRIGVVVSDLYFVDPDPDPGQEGPEQGVRLEVRIFERGPLKGSIYSAQPLSVDRPIWRADLLESVDAPGSFDRAHHHPAFTGWDPGPRCFVEALSAGPLQWVGSRLSDLDGLLHDAAVDPGEAGADDATNLRSVVPEIIDAAGRLLDRVRSGDLAQPPAHGDAARVGWL